MKTIFGEYLKIVMYTLFMVLFAMSVYIVIINIHHYRSLKEVISVSELDNDYSKYKDNVNKIEEKINLVSKDDKMYRPLSKTLDNMKKGGVFRLIPKEKITYKELYELNDYFIEELINNSWVYNIKELNNNTNYQETIDFLINNSKYLNNVFTNNSLVLFDSSLDNNVYDNYHFILNNYLMYSNVILRLCNDLGGVNG